MYDIYGDKMKQKEQTVQTNVSKNTFPKKLYVYKDEDRDEIFYVAQTKAEDCIDAEENNKLVAIYELSRLSILKFNIVEIPVLED